MPSIEKRGANSWRLVVEDGYDATGKRVQRRKTLHVEDEALLKTTRRLQDYLRMELAAFQREVESGQYVKPERTTFADFVSTWKTNYADLHMGAYTRKNYLGIVNSQLLPTFGHLELSKIKTMHIVSFFTQLRSRDGRKDGRDKPLSTNTLLNIYKALKSILDAAERWRVIPSNPMEGVDRPVADKAERRSLRAKKRAYTREEAEQLIIALADEPEHWRLYYLGVVLGGFRRGEMLAVEWPQVDFEHGGIMVEKQLSLNEEGRTVEAELKTAESQAFVPMPRWYMAELSRYREAWIRERWKLQQAQRWEGSDHEYVFHNGTGHHFYADAPSLRWRRFLDKHDLPRIRLHDLRHTTAMLLREDGADLKSIQERLRHSRLATTADLYTHESDLVSRETADRLEKLNPFPIRSQDKKIDG
ncbi:tyrosine-type recombinase/integrase [Alicyclobacillus sp. ALC3]|uniref:tyrosine-type recombinase/integrase n=1 Tax=Alicyclobacillus sp. ALC3 TaxID=2796143 RepID=UPI002379C39E|nr:site-specific integrase [Alicyclobacillus sp. ALC3]WDL96896.1 site-specific integrase [Alicyclobacillus sp. ALC3]